MAEGGRKALELARRSALRSAPWRSKWLHAKLWAQLWMLPLLIFCHTFLIGPAQCNICQNFNSFKKVIGERRPAFYTWMFTVNDLSVGLTNWTF